MVLRVGGMQLFLSQTECRYTRPSSRLQVAQGFFVGLTRVNFILASLVAIARAMAYTSHQ
jgi:hypothetical protein